MCSRAAGTTLPAPRLRPAAVPSLWGGSYANGGSISASNSTVNLEGSLTLAQLGSFDRSGGTVNLKGTLDNTGGTLALDAATGSWNLAGGTIQGGTVSATGGAKLVATNLGGTLTDVTLQGDAAQSEPTLLDVGGGYGVNVGISGDLMLANAMIVLQNYGQLSFSNIAATLAGNGTVLFGDNNSYNSVRETASGRPVDDWLGNHRQGSERDDWLQRELGWAGERVGAQPREHRPRPGRDHHPERRQLRQRGHPAGQWRRHIECAANDAGQLRCRHPDRRGLGGLRRQYPACPAEFPRSSAMRPVLSSTEPMPISIVMPVRPAP
jgi:hypothetical protein